MKLGARPDCSVHKHDRTARVWLAARLLEGETDEKESLINRETHILSTFSCIVVAVLLSAVWPTVVVAVVVVVFVLPLRWTEGWLYSYLVVAWCGVVWCGVEWSGVAGHPWKVDGGWTHRTCAADTWSNRQRPSCRSDGQVLVLLAICHGRGCYVRLTNTIRVHRSYAHSSFATSAGLLPHGAKCVVQRTAERGREREEKRDQTKGRGEMTGSGVFAVKILLIDGGNPPCSPCLGLPWLALCSRVYHTRTSNWISCSSYISPPPISLLFFFFSSSTPKRLKSFISHSRTTTLFL